MRTSFRAAFLVAAALLAVVQVVQPVSGHLVDREVFEDVTPALYDYSRRDVATAISSSTSSAPTATATPGNGCNTNADCASGLCDQFRCVPRVGTGPNNSYCSNDEQCVSGSYCYRGSCQDIKPLGHVCYKDSGCSSGNCVNKKCIANSSVTNGDRCTRSTQCVNGSFCSNSRCDTVKPAGSYCYKNQGCTSNICVNNVCSGQGLARLGQFCQSHNNCLSNFCFRSACRAKRERGRSCSMNETCISNRCRRNRTCA